MDGRVRTWINVSRYHLADRITFTVLPYGILAFTFGVSLAFTAAIPHSAVVHDNTIPGMAFGFYACFGMLGGLSIFRMLPFGLALGVSRRSYYAGTTLLCAGLAVGYGLVLAVMAVIEGATGGWGVAMHLFRSPLLPRPWTITWLTSFVGLTLMSVYGMWFGIIYRRWNLVGMLIFAASQITVLVTTVVIISRTHAGPHIAHTLAKLTAPGVTGLLALLTAALFAGGYATIRGATV
jgi:hypothetical protein